MTDPGYRTVRITTTVQLPTGMDQPVTAVAAALALEGFAAGDVNVTSVQVEVLDA